MFLCRHRTFLVFQDDVQDGRPHIVVQLFKCVNFSSILFCDTHIQVAWLGLDLSQCVY